jgi:hypothetical protein
MNSIITMKNHLYKTALFAALGLAVNPVAKAASDLEIGFNDLLGPSSAQNDYIIDLGSYTALFDNSTVTTTIDSSLFNQAFGTDANALNNVAVGAVAAGTYDANTLNGTTSGKYIYATVNPHLPGPARWNNAQAQGSITWPLGVNPSGSVDTWSFNVAQSSTVPDAFGNGVASSIGNPESNLANGILTLTLYYSTLVTGPGFHTPGAFSELGTIAINANSTGTGSDTIAFYSAIVPIPEPATYGVFAGVGLLVLGVRRQRN